VRCGRDGAASDTEERLVAVERAVRRALLNELCSTRGFRPAGRVLATSLTV
jgi:hypothetical protein